MGDSRRFDCFAQLISRHIPKDRLIADIACGKEHLQAALRRIGYSKVISMDKRKKCSSGRPVYLYGHFNSNQAPKYDAIVAMHPDEATDHAVLYAAKHKVPAIVCPCCIKPSAVSYNGDNTDIAWHRHLTKLAETSGCSVQWTTLPIRGKNMVMIITPKHKQ